MNLEFIFLQKRHLRNCTILPKIFFELATYTLDPTVCAFAILILITKKEKKQLF